MLRITSIVEPEAQVQTLMVEGKLAGPWVRVLRDAVDVAARRAGRVRVDLAGVQFVDADGAALLLDLKTRAVAIVRCSRFVAEVLEGGLNHDPHGSSSGGGRG